MVERNFALLELVEIKKALFYSHYKAWIKALEYQAENGRAGKEIEKMAFEIETLDSALKKLEDIEVFNPYVDWKIGSVIEYELPEVKGIKYTDILTSENYLYYRKMFDEKKLVNIKFYQKNTLFFYQVEEDEDEND